VENPMRIPRCKSTERQVFIFFAGCVLKSVKIVDKTDRGAPSVLQSALNPVRIACATLMICE
jgi:hypothetical protein